MKKLIFFCLLFLGSVVYGQDLNQLQGLGVLPKIHHSWPVRSDMLLEGDPLLREYVRITRAVGLNGSDCTQPHVTAAVRLCLLANRVLGAKAATIDLNYSPFHYVWPREKPPYYTGAEYEKELSRLWSRLKSIKAWLAVSNKAYDSDIQIGALLFDTEVFTLKNPADTRRDKFWNTSITSNYLKMHQIGLSVFPNSYVSWFGQGGSISRYQYTSYAASRTSWFSTWLYEIGDEKFTLQKMKLLVKRAEVLEIPFLMPWIALASGYPERPGPFVFDWDYDLRISHQLGARLNGSSMVSPWNKTTEVAFYSHPFHKNSFDGLWLKHFVAYVQGALGIPLRIE